MNTNEETNKKKDIKAEINIEITGEDKPSKYAIRRARWAVRTKWCLLAVIASLVYTAIAGIGISSFVFFCISVLALFFSGAKALNVAPEEVWPNDFSAPPTEPINFDSNSTDPS